MYWSTGAHVCTASRSKIASFDLGLANLNWYHDESTNVSIVSVSRLAGLPQRGQGAFTNPSCSASGDSPGRSKLGVLGKQHRQLVLGNGHGAAFAAVRLSVWACPSSAAAR